MSKSKAAKWDTSLGLDYSIPPPAIGHVYKDHDFPPLFKNTKLISQSDLEGRGDGFQLAKQGNYVYFCHMFSSGFSVVDVKDPTKPEVVKFIPTGNSHAWNIKCRVLGNTLIVAQEWKFFEPARYTIRAGDKNFVPAGQDNNGPKEPIESGIKIYDISKPAEPKLLSFFKTGWWSKEQGGGNVCHRFSFDGHYAYLSASSPGYADGILLIVDVADPKKPREVSKWWVPGMWIAGGEKPWWPAYADRKGPRLHQAIGMGDRCYTAWFGLCGAILDISNIRRPTLISQFNYDIGGNNHTFLPIRDRKYAIFVSEHNRTWMLDICDEKYPKIVGMFPMPPARVRAELRERGNEMCPWGPGIHNIHENYPGPDSFRSDDRLYTTCAAGGLRIYDMSDPYCIEEIGYYVPGTPKVAYDPRGFIGVDVADVWVDNKGLVYLSSYNGGLEIVEFTG